MCHKFLLCAHFFVMHHRNIYRPQTKFAKVMFLQVSVILSTGGGHAWLLGGHAWLLWGACVVALGGMHGCSGGACVVAPGGHAWLLPRGCAWLLQGVCMVAPGGHAWLLLGGCVWLLPGGVSGCSKGVCVVFSMRYSQ